MSDTLNVELSSSILLETLQQTPRIQEPKQQDEGGSNSVAASGNGNIKTVSSLSLSSSADSGGGGGSSSGGESNSDGNNEKHDPDLLDPAVSPSIHSRSESPTAMNSGNEKSNRTRYSANQLLALRNTDQAKKKPTFLKDWVSEKRFRMFQFLVKPADVPFENEDAAANTPNNYGKNRVVYSSTNGGNSAGNNASSGGNANGRAEIRRTGGADLRDPKERLRKEDGIVLSPQRRSFNMGCQMPAAPSSGSSTLNIGSSLLRSERDILGGRERRIGSGRILSRDVSWDYRPDKDLIETNDYRSSSNLGYRDRERDMRDVREPRDSRESRERVDRDKEYRNKEYDRERDREERFERRAINRDYDRGEKESRNSRISSRYSSSYNSNTDSHGGSGHHNNYSSSNHYHSNHHDRRRLYSDNGRDEEPEWFSEPTSQTDTIELRGFDDPLPEDEDTKSDDAENNCDATKDEPSVAEPLRSDQEPKRSPSSLQQEKNNNLGASDLLSHANIANEIKNDKANIKLSLTPSGDLGHAAPRTPGDGASESSIKTSTISSTISITGPLGQPKLVGDDFNFEDFLKLDELPSSLLYPELPNKDGNSTGGSRFSQWFRQENSSQGQSQQQQQQQPPPQQQTQQQKQTNLSFDSRRSSLQDEINNMINDFTSTTLDDHVPDTNSNKYFAPISPAASTSSNTLLELFQRGEKQQQLQNQTQQQQQQPQQQQQQQQQQQHQQQQQQHHRDKEHMQQPQQQHQPPHSNSQAHHLLGHPPSQSLLHQQQQQQHHQQLQNRNLQQLLGVSSGGNLGNHGSLAQMSTPNVGQIHSVEELEARFRQNDVNSNTRTSGGGPSIPRLITPSSGNGAGLPSNVDQQQEVNAFKKLLAQISDTPHNQLSHNSQSLPGAHTPHHQSHSVNLIHHQQNELLQKMLHLNQLHHTVPDARQAEILKRPEAQALLHGFARGEVTHHNLWQQLNNPATAQPHRELLTSVLSTINTSPRVVSPNILIQPSPGGVPILPPASVPPAAAAVAAVAANSANLLFQHHSKQQMRLSPLPNGMPQRIPSPRELQYHTQSIMQNALIRKKLEEQRENYRKRQEQQQQQQQHQQQIRNPSEASTVSSTTSTMTTTTASNTGPAAAVPSQGGTHSLNNACNTTNAIATTSTSSTAANSSASPAKQNSSSHSHAQHTSSPTPLAFTPTSVLRKMTAEKETDQLSANNVANNNSNTANNSAAQNDRPLLGANPNQNMLLGLNSSMNQQQQQRNLNALISQHPPLQPPPTQQQQGPPQIPHHHLAAAAGHHPNVIAPQMGHQHQPQPQQPPQSNTQQMRGNHQPPGMPGGIPWNLKQPHPTQQMPPMAKPQGRPILKGGNTQQPAQQQHPSPMSQMSFVSNMEFQQQIQQFQNRSGNPILGSHQSQPQQILQQQHNQHQNQLNPHLQQLLQQRQQQQQQRAIRNQHMQQMPPSFRMGHQQQQQTQGSGPGQHHHQGQQQGTSGIINYNRDGGLSPTSNQLARWFSPELLAQASAGKLPSLNIGQAMSLEEFERNMQHSSATVHN